MEEKPVELTTRNVIGIIIFSLGLLFIIGTVGSLDYAFECGKATTGADLITAIIRTMIGLVACGVAIPIGGSMYCTEQETDTRENEDEEVENYGNQ